MAEISAQVKAPAQLDAIIGGTTIPDRAAIVRAYCREGSHVELRREEGGDVDRSRIDVWLQCRSLMGLIKGWKRIGHVPPETAAALLPMTDESSTVVAYGTVRSVYAPVDRDEAVVTVEIRPQTRA